MGMHRPRYLAYLLRLWQVRDQGQLAWRVSLQDARSDARRGFPDVEALTAFLQSEMAKTAQGDEPAVSTPGCGANAASGNSSTDTGC